MLEFIGGAVVGGLLGGGGSHTTHVHNKGPSFPSQINVHEHRAPTDQSVELLFEMEEAARKKFVGELLRIYR